MQATHQKPVLKLKRADIVFGLETQTELDLIRIVALMKNRTAGVRVFSVNAANRQEKGRTDFIAGFTPRKS